MKKLKHYYSFENGVQVSDERLDKWREQILASFEKDKTGTFHSINSGNSLVFGRRIKDDGEESEILITVVRNGFAEYTYDDAQSDAVQVSDTMMLPNEQKADLQIDNQ